MTQHDDAVIVELLSYSLDRLNKEPELLQADSDRLRRQATEQAVAQYGAFLSASECTSSVRREVAGIKEHLEALQEASKAQEGRTVAHSPLLQGLPKLSTSCNDFAEAAERIAVSRAQNRQLLQQHGCAGPPAASAAPRLRAQQDAARPPGG